MKLEPPIEQYLKGSNRSHTSRTWLADALQVNPDDLTDRLKRNGYLNEKDKPTQKAVQDGLIDSCEGKILWRISTVKNKLFPVIINNSLKKNVSPFAEQRKKMEREEIENRKEQWVDLDVIGTYFGVGKVKIGKWLDELGMREYPKMEKNSSGDYDMLDVARQKQQEQSAGFIGKIPSERALERGVARVITVINRKQKEVEITQWNLELCKNLLVKAGHPLDTNHSMSLKGKGKNSNVKVNGMDQRAKELYIKWASLYNDPKTRWQAAKLFRGQPTAILEKVEEYMKMPGYLTSGQYLKD